MSPDYQLWHGDCLQEMDRIESGSVDMILADLPYGTTACCWDTRLPFEPLWTQYKRVIKRNGAIVLFGSQPFTSMLVMSNLDWFKYEWIWIKDGFCNFAQIRKSPGKIHENIVIFSNGGIPDNSLLPMIYNPQGAKEINRPVKIKYGGKNAFMPNRKYKLVHTIQTHEEYPTTILEFQSVSEIKHNTQKPVALLRYLIRTYSNEGDLILDNCAGSGSTLEAAMRESRRSIGIELYPLPDKPIGDDNPDYFGIASKRLANVARELRREWKPLQDNGGSFEGLPLLESIQC